MVYYRKYRPQTISELDSSKLRETLTAVLSKEDVPHAFLLTGPKGLGKTSTARIIAKVINCLHEIGNHPERAKRVEGSHQGSKMLNQVQHDRQSIEPDNICEQCISITNGSNLDVLEIDGASNRGIDEIRDLRDKVKLAPSRAKKKVYIIDEVHMLTTEAFNALLKTIEEPPSHVMFLFCTTEAQKVPDTIVSRCFHVSFPKATVEDIVHSLERVVKGENLDIEKEVLEEVAKLADGGFRDAAKILEELVLVAGDKKITKELIEDKYQISNIQYQISNFLELLLDKKTKESLEVISNLVEQGIDTKYFTGKLLEALHELLLSNLGVSQNTRYKIPNTKYSVEDIQQLVELFSEAYRETKYAVITQLPLELAVVAWCTSVDSHSGLVYPESTKWVSGSGKDSGSESSDRDFRPRSGMTTVKLHNNTKHPMDDVIKKEKNLKVQSILRGSGTPSSKVEKKENNTSQEELSDKEAGQQFMENLLYKVKQINFSVAGVLRGCVVKKLADGELVLETSYKFHKEKLDEAKTREILEKAIKEITGRDLKIVINLKS